MPKWIKYSLIAIGSTLVVTLIEGSLWWILTVMVVAAVLTGIGVGLMELNKERDE